MQACAASYLNYQIYANLLGNVNLQQKKNNNNAIHNACGSVKPYEKFFIIIGLNLPITES